MAKHLPKVDPLAELPVRYEDRRRALPVTEFEEGLKIYTQGVPMSMEEEERAVTIEMDGIGGSFLVKFVKISPYHKRIFSKQRRVLLWGTPKMQGEGRWCFYHPDVLKPEDVGFIAPVYKGRTLISEQRLRAHIWGSTKHLMETIADEVPVEVLRRRGLPTIREALAQIHRPRALPDEKPLMRLAYREMWELKRRILEYERDPAPVIKADIAPFYDLFPFKFTKGQKQAIADIVSDMATGRAMRRLCYGEVGAGKTEVAMAAAYLVSRCGYRSLILSPTTVLASQTYEKFKMRLGEHIVSLFTGEVKESPSMILVGTHAMLNRKCPGVALCVHDESQKFGVEQRNELIENAHGLQLSATPLPRSMELLLHGVIDISVLGECPFPRDVVTKVVPKKETPRILQHMRSVLKEGGKALVIYPLVRAEHKVYKSVESVRDVWEQLYPGQVTYVHGQLEDKLDVIGEFRADPRKKVLVATSLVEAGIDIPEASFLVVAGSERYGITQLHQIRGRIGRRGQRAYCYFLYKKEQSAERLKPLETVSDGYTLSEIDAEQRGMGDAFGAAQSGNCYALPDVDYKRLIEWVNEDMGLMQPFMRVA